MEIEYKGGNCVIINYKKEVFAVDPKLSSIGLQDQGSQATTQLLTQQRFLAPHNSNALIINGPGEYEVHNCSIRGILTTPHMAADTNDRTATIYRLDVEDISIAIIGHSAPKLSETQLEQIGVVDILILPVGGYGYTLEPKEAVEIVRAVEPKIVIPTHYADEAVKYEVPQAPLEEFTKELGITPAEPVTKLKLKSTQLPEVLTVYQVVRTK